MKPSAFDYHAPETVDEALVCRADLGEDTKVLAGGQSLIPMLSLRLAAFSHLVDIGRIEELKGIRRHEGEVVIGAGTLDAAVESCAEIPLLQKATPLIGHFQIRNQGIIRALQLAANVRKP